MDALSRMSNGGNISSRGYNHQRCAAFIYLFKYLSDDNFKSISFESNNDFMIHFKEGRGISAQVKMTIVDFKLLKTQIDKFNEKEERCYQPVLIGSGFSDDVRNFLDKVKKYKNIISGDFTLKEKEETKNSLKKDCKIKELDFNKVLKFNVDSVDYGNYYDLTIAEICKWSNMNKLLVDETSIFNELVMRVTVDKEAHGGSLKRNDIIKIINKHRSSEKSTIPSIENVFCLDKLINREINNLKKIISEYDSFPQFIFRSFADSDWNNYFENLKKLQITDIRFKTLYIISAVFLEEYQQLIEFEKDVTIPRNDTARIGMGIYFYVNKEYQKAYDLFSEISESELSSDFPVQYFIGMCEIKLNYGNALKDGRIKIKQCLNLYNEKLDALIYNDLYELIPHQKNESDLKLLEDSLSANPNQFEALLNKGKFFVDIGDFEKGCYYLEVAGKIENQLLVDLEYLISLSVVNMKLNNEDSVIVYLSKLCEILKKENGKFQLSIGKRIALSYTGYNFSSMINIVRTEKFSFEIKMDGQDYKIIERNELGFALGSCIKADNLMFYGFNELNNRSGSSFDDLEELIKDIKKEDFYIDKYSSPILYNTFITTKNLNFVIDKLIEEKVVSLNKFGQEKNIEFVQYTHNTTIDDNAKVEIYDAGDKLEITVLFGSYRTSGLITKPGDGFLNFSFVKLS